jgi:hypothetical protein
MATRTWLLGAFNRLPTISKMLVVTKMLQVKKNTAIIIFIEINAVQSRQQLPYLYATGLD